MVKILVVGDGSSHIHEVAVAKAFRKLGHSVEEFFWCKYFKSNNKSLVKYVLKLQNKFIIGPAINKLNLDLEYHAKNILPDIIFIYRGTHVSVKSLHKIKEEIPNCLIIGYNNDDPFAPGHPSWLWRHFRKCIPFYDMIYAYRHSNIFDFKTAGARRVELLRSWFIPELNYTAILSNEENLKYSCDVVFVGHYEDDGRVECLEEIVKAGFRLKLYGPPYEWNRVLEKSSVLRFLSPVKLVWGEEYNNAIVGAKIALCFFSKLNRDTYTRRCFEIPAAGTMLISEYSDDLSSLYIAGEEADFFKTKEEMMYKIKLYLEDEILRQQIAEAGQRRVIDDGHDIDSRMVKVIENIQSIGK